MPRPRCPLLGCGNDATALVSYDVHSSARRLRLPACAEHSRVLRQLGWEIEVATAVEPQPTASGWTQRPEP